MKAVINVKGENGNTLAVREVAEPVAGANDILIRVKAVGLNRADLSRNVGKPDEPDANVAGMEVAGEVVAVGSAVTNFAPGDRVMSMTTKAYAEMATADARVAMKIPARLDFIKAAAVPTFFSTAHDAVISNGELARGEAALIQGVAAGVGIAMIQTARAMGASTIAGTSRDAGKLARLREFGLDVPIVSGRDDTVAACLAVTQNRGIDVVVDNIGRGVLGANMDAAAVKARIVSVGRLGGKMDEIDLDKLALKRLKLIGVTFRTRNIAEKAEITRRMLADLGAHFESGAIDPPIDRTFALDEAAAAQDYMRANRHVGKIVLTV